MFLLLAVLKLHSILEVRKVCNEYIYCFNNYLFIEHNGLKKERLAKITFVFELVQFGISNTGKGRETDFHYFSKLPCRFHKEIRNRKNLIEIIDKS